MKSATAVGAAASPAVTASPQATPTPPPGTPDPVHFNGVPTVGALFLRTSTP
jgi:hypothetical protein